MGHLPDPVLVLDEVWTRAVRQAVDPAAARVDASLVPDLWGDDVDLALLPDDPPEPLGAGDLDEPGAGDLAPDVLVEDGVDDRIDCGGDDGNGDPAAGDDVTPHDLGAGAEDTGDVEPPTTDADW